MITKIKVEQEEFTFVTQQYTVGTYLIINNDASMQQCLNTTEEKYHKKIRRKADKLGHTWTGTEL